jgi:hypothetical protein
MFRLLNKILIEREDVLVYCAASISQSTTIVIGYVKDKRSMIDPNHGFIDVLRQLNNNLSIIKSYILFE